MTRTRHANQDFVNDKIQSSPLPTDDIPTQTWEIVFRNGKPYAAFRLPGPAKTFIAQEAHRRLDTVARRKISFKGMSE